MDSVTVTLGDVIFRDFEIPEEIVFGGIQRLAVHQLVGGGRVVDVLGAAGGEISFSGAFSGPDAERRAQLLDIARGTGAVLPLIWSGFAYTVVVAEFSACFRKPWWIPFEIALVSTEALVPTIPDALAQAGLDVAMSEKFLALSGVVLDPTSDVTAVAVAGAQADLAMAIKGAGAVLGETPAAFPAGLDAESAISAMGTLGEASVTLANAVAAQAYLGRAAANLERSLT